MLGPCFLIFLKGEKNWTRCQSFFLGKNVTFFVNCSLHQDYEHFVSDVVYFSVFSGKYDIHVDNKLVGNYENTGSFGELALMYNMPRAATIIATTDGTLWAMVRYLELFIHVLC